MLFSRFAVSSAATLCLMTTAAAADLRAAEVWGDWRSYMEGLGYAVTATESADGSTLSVSDITVQMGATPEGGSMTLRMGPLQFVESGSGTVEVVMPQTMPLIFDITPGPEGAQEGVGSADDQVLITLDYTQTNPRMTVSGDPAAMAYDYSADAVGIVLSALTVDGVPMDATTAQFALSGDALRSQTSVTVGESRSYDQNITLGNMVYDMYFKDPEGPEAMRLNTTVQNLSFEGRTTLPLDPVGQTQDLGPLLAAGFTVDGTFSTQTSENRIEITSEEGISRIKTGSAKTALRVAAAPEGIRYDLASEQVELGGQLAGLPIPLYVEAANSGFSLLVPVMKSDTPQDFSLAANLTGFTMSDIIWALFDPAGQLPRDPATVAVDLAGKARVLIDALDTAQMQRLATGDTPPAEVSALDIRQLTVEAVGARIDATGAFTFDNTDMTTVPGFPKPVGGISIDIAGANGLLDRLVAMGFLPTEQVMGARMMLGLFAVPGAAPDTLNSRIDFNEAGEILANGQRIR